MWEISAVCCVQLVDVCWLVIHYSSARRLTVLLVAPFCNRYEGSPRHVATPGEGTTMSSGSYGKMAMNGKEVYKFATREVPAVLTEALESADMTVDQVDWLLLHQANIRIIEIVADRLGIPMSKVITNLADYGNTSAASIPLALDEAVRSGKVKKGDVIACAGFGAGLSWGAAILKWG
jgi:3-oxoacyl-[acyl-carrier-protein] synthase-3